MIVRFVDNSKVLPEEILVCQVFIFEKLNDERIISENKMVYKTNIPLEKQQLSFVFTLHL